MTKKLPQLWGGKQTSGVTPQQLEDYFAKSREYQSRLDSKNDSQTKSKWVGNRNGAAKSSKATSAVGNPGALRTEPPVQTKPSIPPADGAEASEPQSQKNPARRLSITSSFKAKKAPVLRPAVATLSKDAAIYPGAELVIFDFDTAAISPATKALQQIGFSVTIVPDYEKAVLHCKRESVEVLILALRAPSFHAIHILKSLQPLKSAVIITVDDAPNGLENEINQCFNLGASSCMRKPLNIQRLAHKVVALMELEKNADQVFWESAKYRDPDYAANKAKELIAAAGEFKSMNPEEKKMIRTLDEHGPVAATRKRDKNTFREFTRVQTNNGGARGRANIRNVLTAPSAPRKSTSSSGKKRRSSVRFEDSYPSGKETAFDPLRFAALPWELRDDAYVTKLGFNNNRDFQDSRDILQCELREVIPAESNTSSEHKFLLEGRKMRRSGNLQGAICMYNRAAYASRNCNFWPVFICRGVAFHLVGNDAQAMADFSRCLEIEPDNPDALFNRALLRYTLHDTNGAVADLNEALRLAPEDEEMVYCRGYIFRRLARFDEAKGDYQRHHTLLREREKEAKELRNNSSNKALARSRVDTGLHSKRTRHGHSAGNKQDEGVFGFNFDSDSEDEEKAKRRRDRRTRRRKRRAARIRRQNREQGEWAARGAGPARAAESESDSSSEGSSSSSGDDDDDGSRNGRRGVDDDDDDDLRSLGGSDSGSAVGANTKKEWDMNGDGRVDLEEFKTANNLGDNVFESMFNQKSPLERALQKKSKDRSPQDIAEIAGLLKTTTIFCGMAKTIVMRLAQVIKLSACPQGSLIVQEGATGRNFFVLLSGYLDVKVTVPGLETQQKVNVMGPGDYFGETAMVDPSCIRKAAVECATPCEVLYFSRAVFQQLNMSANIDRIHAEKATILQQTGLFKDLTKEEFQSISQVARYKTFDRNTVVLKQGDMPKYLVILVTGMVKVLQFSDTLADLQRRATEINEELKRFDMGYVYHHSSRQTNTKASSRANSNACSPRTTTTNTTSRSGMTSSRISAPRNFTRSSGARPRLSGVGVAAGAAEGIGPLVRRTSSLKRSHSLSVVASNMPALTGGDAGSAMRANERVDKRIQLEKELQAVEKRLRTMTSRHRDTIGVKLVEVGTAYPPDFFGEMCVLDPLKGRERGSVVSYTHLKVIVINKDQIGTFKNASSFLERIRHKAFPYANHHQVKAKVNNEQLWTMVRQKEMQQIKKTRWPVPSSAIKHLITGGGLTEIIPEDSAPTVLTGLRVIG